MLDQTKIDIVGRRVHRIMAENELENIDWYSHNREKYDMCTATIIDMHNERRLSGSIDLSFEFIFRRGNAYVAAPELRIGIFHELAKLDRNGTTVKTRIYIEALERGLKAAREINQYLETVTKKSGPFRVLDWDKIYELH